MLVGYLVTLAAAAAAAIAPQEMPPCSASSSSLINRSTSPVNLLAAQTNSDD